MPFVPSYSFYGDNICYINSIRKPFPLQFLSHYEQKMSHT